MSAAVPRAFGPALGAACFRRAAEDFRVCERQWVRPAGHGEHWLVAVRKRGITTVEASRRLARHFGVSPRAVSFAGMKDRQAVATQWLSVHAPGGDVPGPLSTPELEMLQVARHHRKLRRGTLIGNAFRIRLHDVSAGPGAVAARLAAIAAQGVPNAFGTQRFGREGDNVSRALAWFRGERRPRGRQEAGILLSAARSCVFNDVLARRVADGTWQTALPGDLLMLAGRNSLFRAEAESPEVLAVRVAALAVHPTGPMPGLAGMQPQGGVAALEARVLADHAEVVEGLRTRGVETSRRSLRVAVDRLAWWWPARGTLELAFALPPGAYATTVLAQCFELDEPDG